MLALSSLLVVSLASTASAAQLRLFATAAIASSLAELRPAFEAETGYTLAPIYGASDELRERIQSGAPFDLAILSASAMDALAESGHLDGISRRLVARSLTAVAIKAGAPKPPLDTVDDFKQALLSAGSIAYTERGLAGLHMKAVLKRLGIEEQMRDKIRFLPGPQAVASGQAELGIAQVSEIIRVPGAALAGALPGGVRQATEFPAALSSRAAATEAGLELIRRLRSPEGRRVLNANGLEADTE